MPTFPSVRVLLAVLGLAVASPPPAAEPPRLQADGLDPALYAFALRARDCARDAGAVAGERAGRYLSVIDYRLPSTAPRLWVLDLAEHRALYTERVAHGRESGENVAVRFSNVPGSNQSSLGLFRTGETYVGQHGRSLRLDGLEPGVNDHARDRAIVIHGAEYCTGGHVVRYGRLGRSLGCPALDPAVTDGVIDTIRDGTLLLAYYPDPAWLEGSPLARCAAGGGDG